MTEKLYDTDSHLRAFTATVLRCDPAGEGYDVVLDRTAFFPEGGGQGADTGTLGGARVTDVQLRGGEILHRTDRPLAPGAAVAGALDWDERFRRMQGHTGEHIVSGLVHRLYGYDNVGFHLGAREITMDYSGALPRDGLPELERMANAAVWENVPVRAEYPAPERLAGMTYRSKLELTENVRIVTVEGYDVCACCAPHVSRTGEIGAIKIVDSMRHRGGTRLTMLCGADALADYQTRHGQVTALSQALSVPRGDVTAAVARLQAELAQAREELLALRRRQNERRIAALPETAGDLCVVDEFPDEEAMRALVNAGMARAGGVCAAFSGADGAGYRYIVGSRHVDLRALAPALNAALRGKGGGRGEMIQGACAATRAEIEAYFAARAT